MDGFLLFPSGGNEQKRRRTCGAAFFVPVSHSKRTDYLRREMVYDSHVVIIRDTLLP